MSNEIPVSLKKHCRAKKQRRDHTSVQQIVLCGDFDMCSQVELLIFIISGVKWLFVEKDLKGLLDDGSFFPPRSDLYPLLDVLILQAWDKVVWQSIPAVTVILSVCWSLCPFKDSANAASPNPKSWSAAQSILSYCTMIQASCKIWMWLIFSGKLLVSGWLLAAAGCTSSSSSPPATRLHSSSLWLSHYSSIKV